MKTHQQDLWYGISVVTVAVTVIFLWPDLLKNLLVANGFIPHGHCYLWKPELVWLHFSSDILIGTAYVAISATLAYLVYKSRQDIPFHWMFLLFGTFIIACGSTHFMEVWTLWTPVYWLSGAFKLITAVASVTTAVVLPLLVPKILALVESAKISQERKQKLEIANKELEALNHQLQELDKLKSKRTEELAQTNLKLQEEIAYRMREQEALRQSEQRFRSYFELPLIGIAITSQEKGWLQVNDKLCEIFGYSHQELSQMSWTELTYPDDLPNDIQQFNRVLRGESEGYALEKRFIRKNGEVIHATIATQCIRRNNGEIDYFVALVQDITERVKAVEKLRLLESVVVNAHDAVVITEAEPINEPNPKIIYVNDAFTRMTGYTQQEVLGKTPRILQGKNTNKATLAQIRAALQAWQSLVVELINYRKDGSEYWVEMSIVPISDEKGFYTHWIAIERDITERKQAEEALYRRKQEFKTLVENSPDVILRCDRQFRYLYVNPVVEKATGLSAETLIGKTFRELGSAENNWLLWEKTLQEVFTKGREQIIEFETSTINGLRNYQSRVVPEFNKEGLIESALVVSRDITELKQAEAERAQLIREQAARAYAETQQKRFAFLAEASMVLASSLDYETTLTQLARLALPYLADWCIVYIIKEDGVLSPLTVAHTDSAKEKLLRELQSLYTFDRHSPHPVLEVLHTGQPIFYPELSDNLQDFGFWIFDLPSKLESEKLEMVESPTKLNLIQSKIQTLKLPQSALVVPLVTQGGTLGAMGFVFAESERCYSLEELSLAEELATRAALAVDNARTHREAQEANRLKDEFLAILSHELRTPLNAILGWASLLRTRKIDAATTERALETIERNARTQTQMVSDLLDVSRIVRGKLQFNLAPINLISVAIAATDTLRPTAKAKGIELITDISNDVVKVAGDPDRLQQVIWNLLSNAIKFTPAGGQVELRLSVERNQEAENSTLSFAQIQVIDNGKGINPSFLPYVFDRFRQENSSITRSYGGLGLGLAIVRHLVELHGGSVSADSPGEGKGATFIVKLPLLPAN